MTLVPAGQLVLEAAKASTGIGAFNVIQLELAEAIVSGAEMARRPAILAISQNATRYHGALEPIAAACLALARASSQPIGVHLDHADDQALLSEAMDLGIDSVMFDGSRLPDAVNQAATAALSAICHRRGASIEAELGQVGGKDGAHAPGARTDPGQANRFAEATKVDALAVAVGSSHAMTQRTATLDFDLIAQLNRAVPVPLVLHGSSGVSEPDLAKAIAAGMTKINIGTLLNQVFTDQVRRELAADPTMVNTRKYFGPARHQVALAVARTIDMLHIA
ncbi:MAG: class II fructose-bisphosphate aldolase family protein [Micrococcales bacterium]|nr:class II fructose-bisphosphate aldolase family protein [Micrococcales bacterium]